jgi:threonine/homoserine/homoserine lactone efflux protein
MLEIFIYAFGIMYTPGPVNLLSLNAGLKGHVSASSRFCVGVGCAMLLLFLAFGYTGAWLIQPNYQLIISFVGSLYIAYLGFKVVRGNLQSSAADNRIEEGVDNNKLNFKNGLLMQLLNPKSFIVILPIATVQFPAAEVSGVGILICAFLLSCLAFGAPFCYLLVGARLGKLMGLTKIGHSQSLRYINLLLAILLLYIAADIFYYHVFSKVMLIGV